MAQFKINSKSETIISLIDGIKASDELSRVDLFINTMSIFDLQARLNIDDIFDRDKLIKLYIKFINDSIMNWSEELIKKMENSINELNKYQNLHLFSFPKIIYIICTNGKNESGAAHCRNMNLILMPISKILDSVPKIRKLASGAEWNNTLIHELFHIWSRNNIELKEKLYKLISYNKIPNNIELPDDLKDLKITNPDAPIIDYYIKLNNQYLAPILVASEKFIKNKKDSFFDYLQISFIILDNDFKSTGKLVPFKDYETELYEHIGKNTEYIIHPEETLADNFVLIIKDYINNKDYKVPSLWVLYNFIQFIN